MSDLKNAFEALFPTLSSMAIEEAVDAIEALKGKARNPWQKTVVKMMASAVEKEGPAGLRIAKDAIFGMLDGKKVKLDFADLALASDALVMLQNAEANRKSEVKDFVDVIGQHLGTVLSSVIKGAIA